LTPYVPKGITGYDDDDDDDDDEYGTKMSSYRTVNTLLPLEVPIAEGTVE
jgi:hypothetical protein